MVFIKNPENLKAEFDIVGSISYDVSQEKIGIKFDLRVRCNGDSQRRSFGIAADRNEVQQIRETFEQNKKAVAEKLEEIKGKIKPLLDLSETVEVSLDEIADQLLEVAKKGFETKIKKRELEEIARRTKRKTQMEI